MTYTEIQGTECDGCGTRLEPVKGYGKLVLCDRCRIAQEEYEDYLRWEAEELAMIESDEEMDRRLADETIERERNG